MSEKSRQPAEESRSGPNPEKEDEEKPGRIRIVLWLVLLYTLGFALMVIEDILSHIFI